MSYRVCSNYLDDNSPGFVVEYRGDFKGQIDKLDYVCGDPITDTLAVVSLRNEDIDRLRRDVPAIIFIETRSIYTLQEISPENVDTISAVKANPYLNLTGRGVLVGLIDTGINYLNREFIREDDTSRVIEIWDQSIQSNQESGLHIGTTYSNEEINRAIQLQKSGGNPYDIVPSIDEVGHGTQMAGVIGARGYNGQMVGVANDCDFLVVKLFESPSFKRILRENNIPEVPVYNNSEVLSAIEYLRRRSQELRRPLVIYLGVGSSEGSHDGYNITARYISSIASTSGLVFVIGTGNLGAAEGHVVKFIQNAGQIDTVELIMPREMKTFILYIWIQRPNRMSLNIVSPTGEETDFFVSQIYSVNERTFYLIDTQVTVIGLNPENFTGHQTYILTFTNIKAGIWKFLLRGDYVTNGRYDIWLQDKAILPEGTKFINAVASNTLSIPSTARKSITVGYYNGTTGAILAASGRGFNTNDLVNPDIVTAGTDILTISKDGNSVVTVSGSSVATAIATGASALLLQWAVIDGNDVTINSNKVRSLLVYAAERQDFVIYPNEESGYGKLDLLEVFNILGGSYRNKEDYEEDFKEYYLDKLYVRIPKAMIKDREALRRDGE